MNYFKKIIIALAAIVALTTAVGVYSRPAGSDISLTAEDDYETDDKPSASRYGVKNTSEITSESMDEKYPIDVPDPSGVSSGIEFDPTTGLYFFRTKVGDEDLVTPFSMTEDEYMDYSTKQSMRDYWRDRISEETNREKSKKFSLSDIHFGLGKAEKVFGPGGVQLKMQGSAELLFGFKINRIQNPALSERLRKPSPVFDFDEKIQLNVTGKVGDRVNFGLNYNTEASFDFDQSKVKLAYEGKEDDIIKKLEAGNVSLPLNTSLIRGSSALFGIRADLQFGKLSVNAVVSQQESESKTISLKNGAQKTAFEVDALDYDENRHFFLSQYFRDNYEKGMSKLPYVSTGVEINRVEVWITNKTANFDQSRNVVAFLDLGETDKIKNTVWTVKTPGLPSNKANSLYEDVVALDGLRDIDKFNSVMQVAYPESSTDVVGGEDYEKLESARRLNENEFIVNKQLGYISLRSQLNADEVLAVAFEYTYGGKVYQVGEFSSDGVEAPNALVLKLIKGTAFSPELPNWDLMMKNVYSLGTSQIQADDFDFNVLYQSDSSGVYINSIPEGNVQNKPLIQVMGLDRLDKRNRLRPDGNFDYVDGFTIIPSTGRIIFPVLEPFGSYLASKIGNDAIAKKYVFQELYEYTKTDAEEYSEHNKFTMRGECKGSSNSEISLGAMNVPKGSVSVTAGGVTLTENVDYTVDYTMGTVTILNQSIIESGTSIDVSLESQSLFSMQRKTLLGTHLEYAFSKDFSVGATVMHLSEKPLTTKVSAGEEPISNTIWGANIAYKRESQMITNLLDKIPFLEAKAPSSFIINGEFAQLIPGHQKAIGDAGYAYIDDFEASKTSINILYPYSWFLASTPQGMFNEGKLINDIAYGKNRALLSWFTIDPLFTRSTSTTPSHIRKDVNQLSNHFVREISEQEIFPNREPISGQSNTLTVLNLAYYPKERGPYNLDVDNIASDGTLLNPSSRWGGIMRKLDVTDFEASNIEYIEFWMMDPFVYKKTAKGGDLYFDLGEISEDILKDGKKSFENGYSASGDTTQTVTSVWGRIPKTQSTVNAFDNDESARKYQDIGIDGLSTADELTFPTYSDFVEKFRAKVAPEYISEMEKDPFSPINDPAGDNYHYYQGSDYDDAQTDILNRYKRYNGMEGNSPVSTSSESYTNSATNIPNVEDINQDNNMNEYEKYFEYKVSLRPEDMQVGKNYISDKLSVNVTLKNGKTEQVTWYQFKIPVKDYDQSYGTINNFKSIRFMRMFLTNFEDTVNLRFGTLELVRGDWRKYKKELYDPALPPTTTSTMLEMSVVNVEENANKTPVNYILPPGVERERDPSQTQVRQENEQSLQMRITDLSPNDARGVYKKTRFDMRQYKRLQMFVHAEKFIDDVTNLNNSDLACFIRLGSDLSENYYEYEVPLALTPHGLYSQDENSSDRAIVWPESNNINFPFSILTDLKKNRNKAKRNGLAGVTYGQEYSEYDPNNNHNKITIKGNPTLGDVQNIMIGIRNKSSDVKSGEIWVNELRMTGFNEDGGWAAMGNATLNLSDFASVNVAGRVETAGFGGIEDNVQDRRMDDYTQFNVSTNAQLGKFFPEKAKVSIPVYYAYGKEVSKPKYDPTNTDLLLKESLETLETGHERDSLEDLAKTVYTTKSFNITNLKVDIKSKKFPMPYDPANFSLSYAYTEADEHNPDVLRSVTRDHKGTFMYQYNIQPKPWEPFKKFKALNKPMFRIIKDINIYYLPSSVNYATTLRRQYEEEQERDLTGAGIDYKDPDNSLLTVSKDFLWTHDFDIKYDFSKELRFSFTCSANSQIDETRYAPVNKELFPTEYENWKDTVMRSLLHGGQPLAYQQTFTANFTSPLNKIPIFSWITSNAMYTGNYTWDRGALTAEDEEAGRKYSSMGNNITSLGTFQWDGRLNFEQLYNKSPYLKRANQRFSSRNSAKKNNKQSNKPLVKTQKIVLKKGVKKRFTHRLNTTNVKLKALDSDSGEYKLKFKVIDKNTIEIDPKEDKTLTVTVNGKNPNENPTGAGAVLQAAARGLMLVRNLTFNYSTSNGMALAGFSPGSGIFGQDGSAPGALFAIGIQEPGWLQNAWDKDWLVKGDSTISSVNRTHTEDLQIKMTLEPFNGFKVDLGVARNYAKNTQIQYQYDGMPKTFTGTFSMTTIAIGTLFKSSGNADNNYHSEVFDKFKANRAKVIAGLERKYEGKTYPYRGFMAEEGAVALAGKQFDPANGTFSQNSAEVLIPAFLNAYTGTSLSQSEIIPSILRMLPNWRITYDGLSRIPFIKRYFKSVNLSHSYVCKYNIGAFSSYANYIDMDGDYGFIPDVATGMPKPSSKYDIAAVSITENFSPLIRVDATLKNSLTFSTEYRRGRTMSLNVASEQLIESGNSEYVFGIGYRLSDFDLILRLKNDKENKVNNDLNLRLDFSTKNTSALIRKLDDESVAQATSGEKSYGIQFSAEYIFSSKLNIKFYYDWESSEPLISSSYPTSNHNFGISLKLLLTR